MHKTAYNIYIINTRMKELVIAFNKLLGVITSFKIVVYQLTFNIQRKTFFNKL